MTAQAPRDERWGGFGRGTVKVSAASPETCSGHARLTFSAARPLAEVVGSASGGGVVIRSTLTQNGRRMLSARCGSHFLTGSFATGRGSLDLRCRLSVVLTRFSQRGRIGKISGGYICAASLQGRITGLGLNRFAVFCLPMDRERAFRFPQS